MQMRSLRLPELEFHREVEKQAANFGRLFFVYPESSHTDR
jgi:hypothetical protein